MNPPLPTIASLLEDAGDGKGGKGDKGKKDPKKDAKVRQGAGRRGGGGCRCPTDDRRLGEGVHGKGTRARVSKGIRCDMRCWGDFSGRTPHREANRADVEPAIAVVSPVVVH